MKMTTEERRAEVSKRVGDLYKMDPDVSIRFMDRDRTLRFTNRAILGVLEDTGRNFLEGGQSGDLTNPKILGSLLHRGLEHHWPEVTRAEVDANFNARHLVYYQSKLMEGLQLFMPDLDDLPKVDDKGEVVEDPTSAQTGNGSDTGRSDAPLASPR